MLGGCLIYPINVKQQQQQIGSHKKFTKVIRYHKPRNHWLALEQKHTWPTHFFPLSNAHFYIRFWSLHLSHALSHSLHLNNMASEGLLKFNSLSLLSPLWAAAFRILPWCDHLKHRFKRNVVLFHKKRRSWNLRRENVQSHSTFLAVCYFLLSFCWFSFLSLIPLPLFLSIARSLSRRFLQLASCTHKLFGQYKKTTTNGTTIATTTKKMERKTNNWVFTQLFCFRDAKLSLDNCFTLCFFLLLLSLYISCVRLNK